MELSKISKINLTRGTEFAGYKSERKMDNFSKVQNEFARNRKFKEK